MPEEKHNRLPELKIQHCHAHGIGYGLHIGITAPYVTATVYLSPEMVERLRGVLDNMRQGAPYSAGFLITEETVRPLLSSEVDS